MDEVLTYYPCLTFDLRIPFLPKVAALKTASRFKHERCCLTCLTELVGMVTPWWLQCARDATTKDPGDDPKSLDPTDDICCESPFISAAAVSASAICPEEECDNSIRLTD